MGILTLIDDAAPTFPDLLEDLVVRDGLAKHGRLSENRNLESGCRSIVTPGEGLRKMKSSG
jgi:hypothetical protein